MKKNIWNSVDKDEYMEIFSFSEEYKNFLNMYKTEREICQYIINEAKKNGFISCEEALTKNIKVGDKIFCNNKNKSVMLMRIGKNYNQKMNLIISHLDSPRLDVKANPVYEDSGIALMKTHYYGGIKKYQWLTIPLSLHGYCQNSDGSDIYIKIGEKENEPIFYISDLPPHLSKQQNSECISNAFTGELLNVIIGNDKNRSSSVKERILKKIENEYGIFEDDFLVGEFQFVPATMAKDVGFDNSMIAAYGHDDRLCTFSNLMALFSVANDEKTCISIFVDKEETGSYGNTSIRSSYFKSMLKLILNNITENNSEHSLDFILNNSKVVSADVTVALDPTYKNVVDENNVAISGCGVVISKYMGEKGKLLCNDANPEFLSEIVRAFKNNDVIWQTGEIGKVDIGGGNTISHIIANYGCEVVDMGAPIISMHAPIELVSKADIYMTYKSYSCFFKNV